MIAFIDTEVSLQSKQAKDFGAVLEDGAVLHTHSAEEFSKFILNSEYICGHNIIHLDLKYANITGRHASIDTLPLSPLFFPNKPYHRLVKDDKLQVDDLNNPVNDAKKARDLFYDELEAWRHLGQPQQEIYYHLLKDQPEFRGFFRYVDYTPQTQNSFLGRLLSSKPDISTLIASEYQGKICGNADIKGFVGKHPIELAYALAIKIYILREQDP